MDPKGFCSWLQGVLDMAETEDGGVTLTKLQYTKIYTKLKEALDAPDSTNWKTTEAHDPIVRC